MVNQPNQAYINVTYKRMVHEVGVTYLSWIGDDRRLKIEIYNTQSEITIPDYVVRASLLKKLKSSC